MFELHELFSLVRKEASHELKGPLVTAVRSHSLSLTTLSTTVLLTVLFGRLRGPAFCGGWGGWGYAIMMRPVQPPRQLSWTTHGPLEPQWQRRHADTERSASALAHGTRLNGVAGVSKKEKKRLRGSNFIV